MALQSINIDDLTFDRLFEVLRGQIAPDWTDHNPSDPGIMFLELFCWLGEMTLYRMNRIPDSHRVKLLNLLIDPPEPATVPVTFTLTSAGTETGLEIPAGTRVATEFAEGRRSVFETTALGAIQLPGELDAEVSVTLSARELAEVRDQELGLSDGAPSQNFELIPPRARLGLEPDHPAPILLDDANRSPSYDPNPRIQVYGAASTGIGGALSADNGVAGILFDPPSGDFLVEAEYAHFILSYAQASRDLTLTRADGTLETVTLGPDPIPAGATEEAGLQSFGLRLLLDQSFDKTLDIVPAGNSVTIDGGSGAIDPLSIGVVSIRGWLAPVPSDTLSIDNLAAPAELQLTLAPGFTGTFDGSSAGHKRATLRDENGDELTIELDVIAAFDGSETLASMTLGGLGNLLVSWREPWGVRHSLLAGASRLDPENPSAARYAMIDPFAHVVRFGDGVYGAIPRAGSRILCRSYRVLRGPAALIDAGAIRYLLDPIPDPTAAASDVVVGNAEDASGGLNFFAESERLAAGLSSLRQPFRMVTEADFEATLPEAFNAYQELAGRPERIDRAIALMNRRPPLSEQRVRPGDVTVMVIRSLDESEQTIWNQSETVQEKADLLLVEDPDLVASSSDALGRRLVRFLDERRLITTKVFVASPDLIAVGILVRAAVGQNRDQPAMAKQIRESILGFVDLLTGGFDGRGWRPGRNLYRSEIYRLVQGLEGVDHVESLTLTPADANGDVQIGDHQMPLAGTIEVTAVRL